MNCLICKEEIVGKSPDTYFYFGDDVNPDRKGAEHGACHWRQEAEQAKRLTSETRFNTLQECKARIKDILERRKTMATLHDTPASDAYNDGLSQALGLVDELHAKPRPENPETKSDVTQIITTRLGGRLFIELSKNTLFGNANLLCLVIDTICDHLWDGVHKNQVPNNEMERFDDICSLARQIQNAARKFEEGLETDNDEQCKWIDLEVDA